MGVTSWTDTQDTILLDGLKADQTYTQIADTLGVSKSMVSGRLYRLRKLRPDDVPPKLVIKKIAPKIAQNTNAANKAKLPKAGTITPTLMGKKNQRKPDKNPRGNHQRNTAHTAHNLAQNLDWKTPSIAIEPPRNSPVSFMHLGRGLCTWCVDDLAVDATAMMMCCAAPVIDKAKREGDRRSSHCAYHYEMGVRRL